MKKYLLAMILLLGAQAPVLAQAQFGSEPIADIVGPRKGAMAPPQHAVIPQGPRTIVVGPLTLPDASVRASDRSIAIYNADSPNTPPLLSGLVWRYDESTGHGAQRKATGIAFFNNGTMLGYLNEAAGQDSVFRNEGSIEGEIVNADLNGLMMRKTDGTLTRVAVSDITYIRSPRAFVFTLTGRLVSTPGTNNVPRSQLESVTFQNTNTAKGLSMTSVVLPKEGQDEEDISDDIDSAFFNRPGAPKIFNYEENATPRTQQGVRPIPGWP